MTHPVAVFNYKNDTITILDFEKEFFGEGDVQNRFKIL